MLESLGWHGGLKVLQVLGRKQIPPLMDTCISPTHQCPCCQNRRECWGAVCPHVAWWDTQNGLPPRSSYYTETPSVLFFLYSLLPSLIHPPGCHTLHLP